MSETARELTVRQYAQQQGITIQTAYRRLCCGRAFRRSRNQEPVLMEHNEVLEIA
jgi:hypothetical protein